MRNSVGVPTLLGLSRRPEVRYTQREIQKMKCAASKIHFLPVSVLLRLPLSCLILVFATSSLAQELLLKTDTFDTDPGWEGRNNRATDPAPKQIVQNFGFSSSTTNAGGPVGEIGGFITPAGEPAFYG